MCCQVHKGPYFFFDLDVQNRNAAYDPPFDPSLFVCSDGVLELKNTSHLAFTFLKAFWMFTSLPSLMKSSQRYQTPDFCLKYPPLYSNRSFFGGFPHIAQKWSKLLGHILTRWCWIRLRPPRIWPYYERECDFRATPYFIPIFWHQCFALVKFLHGYFEVLNPEHVLQPDQPHQLVFGGAVQVLVL